MSARRVRRPRTALIGAGGLARSILPALVRGGYPVTAIAARSAANARSAARLAPGARATTRIAEAVREAQLVLLAVPDRAIGEIAVRLARESERRWTGSVVLHHAGALGVAPLAPLARRGAAVGVLHPLQCLGRSPVAATLLAGSWARVEGDRRGAAAARRLAGDLGLSVLPIGRPLSATDRAAYHAAASVVANDLVALLSAGTTLLRSIGVPPRTALAALARLARGVVAQAEASGLAGALTGPVARGDAATWSRQMRRLERGAPDVAEAHRLLSRELLRVARAAGRIDPAAIAAFERLLEPAPPRPRRRRAAGPGSARGV